MPYKNPEDGHRKRSEYHALHRERDNARAKAYYRKNRESLLKLREEWRNENRGYSGDWYRARRLRAIDFLGGKCVYCGVRDPRVLSFNHINGGGMKEYATRARNVILREILEGTRPDIELACFNCNQIHRIENGFNGGRKRIQ